MPLDNLLPHRTEHVTSGPFRRTVMRTGRFGASSSTPAPDMDRRRFVGRVFGAAAAAGVAIAGTRLAAAAQEAGADDWIKEVKGTHRCLFDFPQHKNGFPLLHILNYLNTYARPTRPSAGQVGAVGTFYSVGQRRRAFRWRSTTPSGRNTSSGVYTGLKDADREGLHAERLQPADAQRSAPVDAGHRLADDSGAGRRHAGAGHREPAEDGRQVHPVRERARHLVSGARSQRQGQGGGHREGAAEPTCCRA